MKGFDAAAYAGFGGSGTSLQRQYFSKALRN